MNLPEANRVLDSARIVRLVLERNESSEVTLTLSMRGLATSTLLTLRFRGVADLRFRGEQTDLNRVVRIIIDNVSSRGWEGINFQVRDYEEEFIAFYCLGFEQERGDQALVSE